MTEIETKQFSSNIMGMNLKTQLKFYIRLRELTAAELARRSGVSKQTLSQWSLGTTPRDILKVKQVADALQTTVDNLMFGEGLPDGSERMAELEQFFHDGHTLRGIFEVHLRMLGRK